jgi:hypothetical protein
MSTERKKAEKKPVPKVEPKKRIENDSPIKVEDKKPVAVKPKPNKVMKEVIKEIVNPIILETTEKVKRSENKYVRLAYDAKPEEKKEFSDKVQKGELKLACYAIDSDKGYYYYLVIKK